MQMIISLHAARLLVFLPLALGFVLQANPGAGQARVEKTTNELGSPSLAKEDYENDHQIAEKKPPDYHVWRVLGPSSKGQWH